MIAVESHPLFKRENTNDLLIVQTINLAQALTGPQFQIKHLSGKTLNIKMPLDDVIKPGDTKIIREMGLPVYRQPGSYGNLFIKFEIDFPRKSSITPLMRDQLLSIFKPPGIFTTEAASSPKVEDKEEMTKSGQPRKEVTIERLEEPNPMEIQGRRDGAQPEQRGQEQEEEKDDGNSNVGCKPQ